MKQKDIAKVIKTIDPDPLPGMAGEGPLYRCAATLNDGTSLPCVLIAPAKAHVELAKKRFEETRNNKSLHPSVGYNSIVKSFVCSGNKLNDYDIKELSISEHAIPLSLLRKIIGETAMGWTEFIGIMQDGKDFCFGTTFDDIFFDMPPGYKATDLKDVKNVNRGEPRTHEVVYREKPFFTCYLDQL